MRNLKGVDFGALLRNKKEAEELLQDLKVGVLSGSGHTWLPKLSCFVFYLILKRWISRGPSPEQPHS